MEPNVPNNSDKARSKEGQPKTDSNGRPAPQKVVEGVVVQRKKPFLRRLKETILTDETGMSLKEHLVFEVIVPAMRDAFLNTLHEGINRTFRGAVPMSRYPGQRTTNVTSYTNYNQASTTTTRPVAGRTMSPRGRANHDFNEMIFNSYSDANEVLTRMKIAIEDYGNVSVAHLYTLSGVTPSFTDERWGWIDLSIAGISNLGRGQYLLNLPDPEPIVR